MTITIVTLIQAVCLVICVLLLWGQRNQIEILKNRIKGHEKARLQEGVQASEYRNEAKADLKNARDELKTISKAYRALNAKLEQGPIEGLSNSKIGYDPDEEIDYTKKISSHQLHHIGEKS